MYILDIEFPGKNGMEVADFIRQNDFNVPIIFFNELSRIYGKSL